jgi:hypothetical protein
MLAGESAMVKSDGFAEVTVNVRFVVCVRLPLVPVIVMVDVPVAAVELTVSVRELVDVVGLVPKLAVTPAGNPEADRVTLPVKPPEGVTVIVLLPLLPCLMLAGEAERAKFGVLEPAGGRTQLLAALENSNWMVYVVPLAV